MKKITNPPIMAKKKGPTYEEKLINALNSLPYPLEDKRHNLLIYFDDDRARSNQNRFQHIIDPRHELKESDIERILEKINEAILKKDKERTDTFNLYIRRVNYKEEYLKISLRIEPSKPHDAYVKTLYITNVIK